MATSPTNTSPSSRPRRAAPLRSIRGPLQEALRTNYWFVPLLFVTAAAMLALSLVGLDRWNAGTESALSALDLGQPSSARSLLTTIASASISIATLTFSMTIVALTLTTSQFGSRLLYNFMRDRSNQAVLGTFVGIFTYCILVLQSVRAEAGAVFVPHTAVLVAIVLAIVGVAILIYYVHHTAQSIQADAVIAAAGTQLQETIDSLFPHVDETTRDAQGESLSERGVEAAGAPTFQNHSLSARDGGILQAIDVDALVAIATECGVEIRMQRRPGDHVIRGTTLLHYRNSEPLEKKQRERLLDQFRFGQHRTLVQDMEFALHQLVEIAVRALSPGINDPFTAIACVNEIGAGVARMLTRADQNGVLCDAEGVRRVQLDVSDFEGFADSAFTQIRQHARDDLAVSIRLLQVFRELAIFAESRDRAAVLAAHAERVHATASNDRLVDSDQQALNAGLESARLALTVTM